jgi:hypothetical protein
MINNQLRLTTWNCKGGFRQKQAAVARLQPDVLIVPEAPRFTGAAEMLGGAPVKSIEWFGDDPRKGLGVISYGEYALTVRDDYDPSLRWIVPLRVTGPQSFTLLAVWTLPDPETKFYITCLFKACEVYRHILEHEDRVVIAGDLNQSVRFDRPRSQVNYTHLLEKFASYDLASVYHLSRGCEQGTETEPTFYLHHKEEKPHHLDYIFSKPELYRNGVDVTVGEYSEWKALSDHMPLSCSFKLSGLTDETSSVA